MSEKLPWRAHGTASDLARIRQGGQAPVVEEVPVEEEEAPAEAKPARKRTASEPEGAAEVDES